MFVCFPQHHASECALVLVCSYKPLTTINPMYKSCSDGVDFTLETAKPSLFWFGVPNVFCNVSFWSTFPYLTTLSDRKLNALLREWELSLEEQCMEPVMLLFHLSMIGLLKWYCQSSWCWSWTRKPTRCVLAPLWTRLQPETAESNYGNRLWWWWIVKVQIILVVYSSSFPWQNNAHCTVAVSDITTRRKAARCWTHFVLKNLRKSK